MRVTTDLHSSMDIFSSFVMSFEEKHHHHHHGKEGSGLGASHVFKKSGYFSSLME